MKSFWLCFVPFFVAVDSLGVLPLFLGLTEGMSVKARRRVIVQSLVTAFLVAVLFLLAGPAVLKLVGVGVADFLVAGGILLLVLSLTDILTGEKRQRQVENDSIGAVPIGVPLLAGPAVLTTSLLLATEYGIGTTVLALLANIAIVGLIFNFAGVIATLLGPAGSRTLSKVASLLLAAFAVMLIRKGLFAILGGG